MACVEIVRRAQAPTGPLPVTDLCRRRTCNAWFVSTASENDDVLSDAPRCNAPRHVSNHARRRLASDVPGRAARSGRHGGFRYRSTTIRPFQAGIPDEQLVDLRRRIAATRWPDRETVNDQSQGIQLAKIKPLVEYWGSGYDWRKAEAKLNAYPQFKTNIDGLDIHFIHVKSKQANALPIIITHG